MRRKGLMILVFIVICAMAMTTICPLSFAQQEPPVTDGILTKLSQLKTVIAEFSGEYNVFTDTNTAQQANALYNKIDVVMRTVEQDHNYRDAINKLENDISPKVNICVTTRDRARSWLSDDPALHEVVVEFENICQGIIEDVLAELHRLVNG